MFNFLSGMMGKAAAGGGMARGLGGGGASAGAAGGAGGGFMSRLRTGLQNPQTQQALGGIGAQMMGFDPAMGMAAAQGMQDRRFSQGLQQGIAPMQRQQIDPRQFMPQRQRFDLSQLQRMPMPSQGLGGGGWQDPRLGRFGRENFQTY